MIYSTQKTNSFIQGLSASLKTSYAILPFMLMLGCSGKSEPLEPDSTGGSFEHTGRSFQLISIEGYDPYSRIDDISIQFDGGGITSH